MTVTSTNNNNHAQETICKVLFNKEAEEIFDYTGISGQKKKRIFIDECLRISMRVCSALFKRDDALALFSHSLALNEACLFYSYRVVKLKASYHLLSEEERLKMTPDNCFLLLQFFLNNVLLQDINQCFCKVFKKTMNDLNIPVPKPKKYFKIFLQDPANRRLRAALMAYNVLFKTHLQETLAKSNFNDPVYAELYELSKENLIIEYGKTKKIALYSYPLFGLLVLSYKKIQEDQVSLMIKVKVITKEGVEGVLVKKFGQAMGNQPVLVFDAIGTDGSFGVPHYRDKGQECLHNYFRYDRKMSNLLHDEKKTCFYCHPNPKRDPAILEQFQERLNNGTEDLETLFYALGADAGLVESSEHYLAFFNNEKKYPKLSKIFQDMRSKIIELGLHMNKPLAFAVATAHINTAAREDNDRFYLDRVPESYVEEILEKPSS